MKVGDLVRYSGSKDCLGIVIRVLRWEEHPDSTSKAYAVRWVNGVTSNHSAHWLIKVKTSEDT
tara:strand:+ start:660 stop:848 length:189 start_codon:yes stop_codon:yes gene_type:complete